MLACGAVCKPTEVVQELERFESSTKPARIKTDDGIGFAKSIGNPQGDFTLASELICAELAVWFGLAVPPFAVIPKCEIQIPIGAGPAQFCAPLFFSLQLDGVPRDGTDTFLKRLRRRGDVAKLIVFDTWVRNCDRHGSYGSNSDNLLYVRNGGQYDLVPIDHSHCLIDTDCDTDLPARDGICLDENVYGFFPEFSSFVGSAQVADAVAKLDSLDQRFVEECVNSVPTEWGLLPAHRAPLVNLICCRAKFVVNTIAAKLIEEPELPFGAKK